MTSGQLQRVSEDAASACVRACTWHLLSVPPMAHVAVTAKKKQRYIHHSLKALLPAGRLLAPGPRYHSHPSSPSSSLHISNHTTHHDTSVARASTSGTHQATPCPSTSRGSKHTTRTRCNGRLLLLALWPLQLLSKASFFLRRKICVGYLVLGWSLRLSLNLSKLLL